MAKCMRNICATIATRATCRTGELCPNIGDVRAIAGDRAKRATEGYIPLVALGRRNQGRENSITGHFSGRPGRPIATRATCRDFVPYGGKSNLVAYGPMSYGLYPVTRGTRHGARGDDTGFETMKICARTGARVYESLYSHGTLVILVAHESLYSHGTLASAYAIQYSRHTLLHSRMRVWHYVCMNRRAIRIEVTREQASFIQRRAAELGLSVSNYVRRAAGLPDVIQGQRNDLKRDKRK